jgi:hypothetical protein
MRYGRQYLRAIADVGGENFGEAVPGHLVAWSRILDDEESVCVVNSNGREERSARVLVDADLNPPGSFMTVALNTSQVAGVSAPHPVGEAVPVKRTAFGMAYVEIRGVPASETLLLVNHP